MKAPETKFTDARAACVGDIAATRKCLSFQPEQYVKLILPAMRRAGAGCAGVVDEDNRLKGMLTEREILRRIFAMLTDPSISQGNIGKHVDDMIVRDVMITNPISLNDDMDIEDASARMAELGFRFMPVVSRSDGRSLIGLVDEREVAIHVKNRLDQVKRESKEKENLFFQFFHEPYGAGYSLSML